MGEDDNKDDKDYKDDKNDKNDDDDYKDDDEADHLVRGAWSQKDLLLLSKDRRTRGGRS